MTPRIDPLLALHRRWLAGESGGEQLRLAGISLRGADLRGADLRRAELIDVDLTGADFTGARAAGAVFVRCSLTSATAEDCDFDAASFDDCRLERLNGHGVVLSAGWLINTVVTGASLAHGSLRRATAIGTDFTGTDLTEIDGVRMSATSCSLLDVLLVDADLRGATFGTCRFDRARLAGAKLDQTAFVDCDLLAVDTKRVDISGLILAGSSVWPGTASPT